MRAIILSAICASLTAFAAGGHGGGGHGGGGHMGGGHMGGGHMGGGHMGGGHMGGGHMGGHFGGQFGRADHSGSVRWFHGGHPTHVRSPVFYGGVYPYCSSIYDAPVCPEPVYTNGDPYYDGAPVDPPFPVY